MTHVWSLTNIFTKNVIRLDKPLIRAGRNRSDEIVCRSIKVSRNHANFLINSDGVAHIQDNNSLNGTYVNNVKIQAQILYQLKDGDQIGLGLFNTEQQLQQAAPPYYIFEVTHCKIKVYENTTQDLIVLLNDSENELDLSSQVQNEAIAVSPKSVKHFEHFNEVEFVTPGKVVKEQPNLNIDVTIENMKKHHFVTMKNCVENTKNRDLIMTSSEVIVNTNMNIVPEEVLKPKAESMLYSSIDQCSIIDISDEEDEELVCSQLYTSQINIQKSDNKASNVDNLFSQIKKELEEMDQLDYVPDPVPIDLDSDNESDWLADLKLPEIEKPVVKAAECSTKDKEVKQTKRKSKQNSDATINPPKKCKKGRSTKDLKLTLPYVPKKVSTEENIDIMEQRRQRLKEIALKTVKESSKNTEISNKSKKEIPPNVAKVTSNNDNIIPHVHTFDIVLNILSWPTSWLEEQVKNKEPPPINKQPVLPMAKCFQTYNDYYKTIIPLLTYELWDSIYRDYEKGMDSSSFFKIRSGGANLNKNHRYTQLECIKYLTKDDITQSKYPKDEDLVLIHIPALIDDKIIYRKVFGYISGMRKQNIYAKEKRDPNISLPDNSTKKCLFTVSVKYLADKLMLDKPLYIRLVTSITSHLRVFKSVKYLQHSPVCQMILKPQIKNYKLSKLIFKESSLKENLNATQKKIVAEAATVCVQDEPGVYLIKGPPGTGKSTIIINIISQILLNKSVTSKDTCILLVAPSNAAIDELTNRILFKVKPSLPENKRRSFKLVRIGPKQMIHPNIKLYCLNEITKRNVLKEYMFKRKPSHMPYINKINALKEEMKITKADKNSVLHKDLSAKSEQFEEYIRSNSLSEFNTKLKTHESDILKGANIICSTLSSCLRLSLEDSFRSFPNKNMCVIVDEATQSQEPETLIPLTLGINRIVLVGDPKQLPATTISWAAKKLGYGQSLFSRIEEEFRGVPESPIRMLTVQYRMHPMISQYPNMAFYDNMLENCFKQKKGMEKLKPYLVLNVNGNANQNYSNEHEVNCVVNLLEAINEIIGGVLDCTIGIITPYNNQKDAIMKKIKNKHFKADIAVNTVDSFQGQEKDVIILSCVRSNTNNFLEDEKRLNVALTRAKSALYIIGTYSLFSGSHILGKLRQDAELRNLVVNVAETVTVSNLKGLILYKASKRKM